MDLDRRRYSIKDAKGRTLPKNHLPFSGDRLSEENFEMYSLILSSDSHSFETIKLDTFEEFEYHCSSISLILSPVPEQI